MTHTHEEVGHTHASDRGMGFIGGVILLILAIALFLYYGLPVIRSASTTPQINVPNKVDVNVHQK